ncbi:acyl-CoA N-acyltransferase [Lichtheimia hyalospora FSU 10163]|nr:acyl-CoA N-acyltransferase [Lichtheimia hyalospora FSU 10163]
MSTTKIVQLTADIPEDKFNQVVKLFQQLSSTANPTLVQGALASTQNQVIAAEDLTTGDIVGVLIVAMTPCASGTRVHIEDVVVDSSCRGQGVGTQLLTDAIRRAKDEFHARTIDLTSRPERTSANRLYQRLGFQPRDTNVYRYTP